LPVQGELGDEDRVNAATPTRDYDFLLVLDLQSEYLSDDEIDILCEAGCCDGTFGVSNGVPEAGFTREAADILDAITSAISDIETAGVGATVVRVEPDDLVSIGDIAERTGRTAESIRLLIMGRRGPGGFPAPAMRIGMGRSRLWRWAEVVGWFHDYEPARWDEETTRYWAVIATVNDILRQRKLANRTDPIAAEVRGALAPALERG
jgi:hypothetical protein